MRDQAVQFLEANGNPLDADERKLLCHFIVELRRILACMLLPCSRGWLAGGTLACIHSTSAPSSTTPPSSGSCLKQSSSASRTESRS